MQIRHVPAIGPRYWAGIVFASIFGTNMGDFYAHESGLGLLGGLPILIALFAAVFVIARFDRASHQAYYWACIIIMRTGATNIADELAGRHGLAFDRTLLSAILALALAALAWRAARAAGKREDGGKVLPDTDALYWVAMLTAGVFGTVFGDLMSRQLGQGAASLVLGVALAAALVAYGRQRLPPACGYWLAVAAARSAGTSIGDFLAENKIMDLGLPTSTLLTGIAFCGVLLLWRDRRPSMAPASA